METRAAPRPTTPPARRAARPTRRNWADARKIFTRSWSLSVTGDDVSACPMASLLRYGSRRRRCRLLSAPADVPAESARGRRRAGGPAGRGRGAPSPVDIFSEHRYVRISHIYITWIFTVFPGSARHAPGREIFLAAAAAYIYAGGAPRARPRRRSRSAPDACLLLLRERPLMQHDQAGGWRVLPCGPPTPPLRAWHEDETARTAAPVASLDDGHCLLDPASPSLPPGSDSKKKDFPPRPWREKLTEALRPPYFMLTMVALLVGTHWAGGECARRLLEWEPGAWRHEPWRFLSYAAVHASATHLAPNALVALAVGWWLEREQGAWRVAVLWAGGVAAGALGAGVLQPHVRVVGASAAVYALLTSHIPNVCLRFGHVPLWWFRPLSVLVLSASDGCWTLVRADASPSAARVAWAAHVTGALAGVPLGFLLFSGERADGAVARACRLTSLAVLTALSMVAVVQLVWRSPDG